MRGYPPSRYGTNPQKKRPTFLSGPSCSSLSLPDFGDTGFCFSLSISSYVCSVARRRVLGHLVPLPVCVVVRDFSATVPHYSFTTSIALLFRVAASTSFELYSAASLIIRITGRKRKKQSTKKSFLGVYWKSCFSNQRWRFPQSNNPGGRQTAGVIIFRARNGTVANQAALAHLLPSPCPPRNSLTKRTSMP